MVQINFDASQVAPNAGFEALPEGWYNVAIAESEMKPTKDGEGAYLQLKAKVIDGAQAGKSLTIRLNVQNKNQQAVDIAYGELSAICHVTGVYRVQDSSQLHGIPFQVKAVVSKSKDKDGNTVEGNDVKAYKDAMGNDPGKAGAAPAGNAGAFGGMQQQPPAQPNVGVQPGAAPAFGGQPSAPPAPVGNQRPADPSHIHAAGTPGEMWWINGAWVPATVAAPTAPPAPASAPAAWGGGAPAQQAQQPGPGPAAWTQPAPGAAPGGAPWGAPAQG